MRIVNGIFCVILILFAGVQYNDPDFLLWGGIYGLGAVFAGIAAFAPRLFAVPALGFLYPVVLAASVAGLIYYWPTTPHWWMQEVWWETETAREGMGMMIVLAAMLAAGWAVRRTRRQG